MSEPAATTPPRSGRTWGRLATIVFCTFLICFLFLFLMAGIGFGEMQLVFTLAFGWVQFLQRTVPRISWNWDLAGMGLLCAALILFLAHRFLNWMTRSIATARGQSWRWPWKWTWCGLLAISLFFLTGMAIGGTAHQIGWIASSDEPLIEPKPRFRRDYRDMHGLSMTFSRTLHESNTVEAMREIIRDFATTSYSHSSGQPSLPQSYHLLLVVEADGKVTGLILFPRNPEHEAQTGGYFATDNDIRQVPAKNLPELIRSHQEKLVTF